MGNAPESQVDPNGTASSNYMSAYMPDYQQIMGSARYFEGMMPTASSHLPGGALWGAKKGPFEGISWAGMSGAVLANYLEGAGADLKSIILSNMYESGSFLVNAGSPGGGGSDGDTDKGSGDGDGDTKKKKSADVNNNNNTENVENNNSVETTPEIEDGDKKDKLRGGKKKDRDRDIQQYPKEFQRWYHKDYKPSNNPGRSVTSEELRDIYEEWEDFGKPTVKISLLPIGYDPSIPIKISIGIQNAIDAIKDWWNAPSVPCNCE